MSDYDWKIGENVKGALDRYIQHGLMPGGFLEAVLSNDLFGAVGRADSVNINNLKNICGYVWNELPSNCWGSPEKVREWLDAKLKARSGKGAQNG